MTTPQHNRRFDLWSFGAMVIAAIVLLPICAVLILALGAETDFWAHLWNSTLPRYLRGSFVLMTSVGVGTALVGTGTAWLISRYDFALRRWLEWLLLLPLAIPAYIGAYALVDFYEYAGPVQTGLRQIFGWQTSRDYWFFEPRSMGAAIVVMTAALYPYVYLLARNAFRDQSSDMDQVARSLGRGAWSRFWRIGLPLARPAIVAGVAIVMMETVNDFGTVDYFAVQTLTTGIFSVWLEANNAGGAAQLSSLVLGLAVLLVLTEKASRRKARFFELSRQHRPAARHALTGMASFGAMVICLLPVLIGFVQPVAVLASHAFAAADQWRDAGLIRALWHTISVGGIAAVLSVTAGVFLVYAVRLSGSAWTRLFMPITTIGYAAPGAVLGVGVLLPMAALDHWLADRIEAVFGIDTGLVLTGTAAALILAYCVRFFAIAQGAADAAMGRISPSLGMAARSLGRRPRGVLAQVYYPLMRASLGSALLLVFVDCVKELPATLLLRPFNYDTLATRVYEQASLENIGQAAPAALIVIAVGLCAVGLLARASR